jgi:predicted PurR-regulated permease PerM
VGAFPGTVAGRYPQIVSKVGELAGFFVSSLSSVTRGTASFFMSLFVMLYAMAYFLQERISV